MQALMKNLETKMAYGQNWDLTNQFRLMALKY